MGISTKDQPEQTGLLLLPYKLLPKLYFSNAHFQQKVKVVVEFQVFITKHLSIPNRISSKVYMAEASF